MTAVHIDVKPINCFIDGRAAFITSFGYECWNDYPNSIIEYHFANEISSRWIWAGSNRIFMPPQHNEHVKAYYADYIAWGLEQYKGM